MNHAVATRAPRDSKSAAAFWRAHLEGASTALDLPLLRPAAESRSAGRDARRLTVSDGTAVALRALVLRQGTTLEAALLAVFAAALSRWSGERDLLVGVPLGLDAPPLPLRFRLDGDPGFRALLSSTEETLANARAHAQVPSAVLRDALDGGMPQVGFAFGPRPEGGTSTPLSLWMWEDRDGLSGTLLGAGDADTMERMAAHFALLLDAVVADPDRPVSTLPILTDPERTQLATWQTGPLLPAHVDLFPAQLAATVAAEPDTVALLCGTERVTYAELDARANRLAHHFRSLGVGPDVRVGICLYRSPDLVVAALAVLKAGGAYVPVEPWFPADRIAAVMADADARVLLTTRTTLADLALPATCTPLALDERSTRDAIDRQPEDAPAITIDPESLAHVIYTSGSTGTPKGVMIRHASVAGFVAWMRDAFPLAPGERVLGATSFAFDVHVAELHYTLASGGTLVLVDNALSLAELPADAGIVQASMVPSAARELLALGALPGSIRRLNLAGEALPDDLARDLYAAGIPELHNVYGPTEDTTYSTHALVPERSGRVTIGRSFSGRRAYVLDRHLAPVPVGVTGDLFLAGCGVARGYLGRAGLTAEKFVPDPFGAAGERMYATGDRARWTTGGEIEYLGRSDFQVKIRGFRIELGEIETVLRTHPAVAEAVVTAHGTDGAKRLVAYVSAPEGTLPDRAILSAHLKERLPEYMVPAAFVVLDAFPRTSSGKLDRRALPEPEFAQAAVEHVAPRTRSEGVLASIWAAILGMEQVGANANFFDLGGHSLLATRVVSRVREAFGVELPLRTVFEAPVLADLARRIDGMDAHAVLPPIRPIPRDVPPPLSFAQQRLWFLDQLEPGSAAYNMPSALRIRGRLDVAALERSIDAVLARHEALRTTFAAEEGSEDPVQIIHPASGFTLSVDNLAEESDPLATARIAAADEAAAPFDLANGPLFRARLLRLAEDDHVLLITMHHVASDGWSMDVLWRELQAGYTGAFSDLAPLPVQYADYAVWQRKHLSGAVLDAQLRYWRERLADVPTALELPADRPRPPHQSYRGEAFGFALPAETAASFRALARAEGATLYMTLLAAYGALLSRWSGQDDVVIGSPVAGRTREELEGLIGFFVNTLPLRADLGGEPSFRELLARLRETVLEAQAHQDVPFERLVEELRLPRDPSRSPLFQAMFLLQERAAGLTLSGMEIAPLELDAATAKFDITLTVVDDRESLSGILEYAADLFDARTTERMAAHFALLLDAVVADPDRPVSTLPILTDPERAQLATWQTGPLLPAHVDLFPAQLAATVAAEPDTVALLCGTERVTYAELDARANRLAHHLRSLGVGPDVRVGICLDRSPDLVVAALAVLKAGGAYVPVEPWFPADRIAAVMADADAAVLVASSATLAGLALPASCTPLALDERSTRDAIDRQPEDAPAITIDPESLAHVIYTSGSTGTPKGVMIRHASVAGFVAWMRDAFPLAPGERVLGATSFAFDVHVAELHYTLASGGTLVLVDNALSLAELAADAGIVQASMVPSAARELLALGALPGSIRRLNLAGEALPDDLARDLYAAGIPELHNVYGPTEDTTYSTHALVPERSGRVTIGRSFSGRRAYVLDRHLAPVPVGVTGDLFLAGCGVARGYLGRASLTAEKFVPDPFGAAGQRMYATGDRARWTASGEIEYLGRSDFQVKIRGFRIELGEIETVLRTHPAVAEAVVTAHGTDGAKRLVAYVSAPEGTVPDRAILSAHLKERLPEYMVPAAFVVLDAFPRTSSGKLDRRALPEPEFAQAAVEHVAPRTRSEGVLASIWAAILGMEQVGANANFFDLGGHSLLATRVVSRVREAFGVELPLRTVFEAPVLADLARRIDGMDAHAVLPPIRPIPRDVPPPLSFAQQRLWFLDQLEPGSAAYNMPSALRIRGRLDVAALERSIDAVLARHEALRTTFAAEEGSEDPVQIIHPASGFTLSVDDLAEESDPLATARIAAADEAAAPFDLANGPLFRARLLRLAEDDHVLLITMHHVASDGWSMDVLWRELQAGYTGAFSDLAPLLVQYADYAVWQRKHLSGAVLDAQLRYWRERLADVPTALELPTDRPRPAHQSYRGADCSFQIAPAVALALRLFARTEGATLFTALLAAYGALLSRWSGQDDVVIGSPVAGRTREELEGLIGFFVNTLPLRADLGREPSFRELLARLRETVLEAQAHQDVPFERLVEELRVPRDPARTPLFQAMFLLRDPIGGASLGTLETTVLEQEATTAKFDLTLTVEDEPNGFRCVLQYAADLFDTHTMERMAAHFALLLDAVVADPDRPVSTLPILTDPERAQLATWQTGPLLPAHVDLFPAQLAATVAAEPDTVALLCGTERVTYAELDARANRLAHHLRSLGVGPDVRVGICLHRSPDLVVAALAVLKAGGAYVPVEPWLPAERIAAVMADADARVLLTTRTTLADLSLPATCTPLALDERSTRDAIDRQPEDAPAITIDPESLAHVIYTSGSTGTPKGVMIRHASVAGFVAWMRDAFPLAPGERVLGATSFAFDVHVAELHYTLASGGTLVLVDNALSLAELAADAGIVQASMVPSAARELLALGALPGSIRRLNLAGEALPDDLARDLYAAGIPELHNVYGPTEDTTYSTHALVPERSGRVTIGRSFSGRRAYVLDRHLAPVPVGVTGDLFLAGCGVARGYLGRAGLTAEKFVPDPFGAAGQRMYATGDRARWTASGEIEYLGRSDFQVKIRGFRIELGEIETVLRTHPAVAEAVVTAHGTDGAKRLVAYVSAPEGTVSDRAILSAHLKERLPEYMVPAAFVVLDAFPRTSSGKLDRRALPEPEFTESGEYVRPRLPSEEALASVWARVLGVDRVSATANFFDLGGHSLLATRVVSRVREAFGVELPLRAVFEAPVLADLARRIDGMDAHAVLPPIRPIPRDVPPPLSFAQQRLWFLDQLEPGSAAYNMPSALRIRGRLDVAALERSINAIVARHEVFRTTFATVEGREDPVQVIHPATRLRLRLELIEGEKALDRAHAVAAEEAAAPFDLARGPLFRARLLRLTEDDHVLLITMHHVASDGWSMDVLWRELRALYAALVRGERAELPPLPVQYADYAVWQRTHLPGAVLDAQMRYWHERMKGAPTALELPADHPRPALQSHRGGETVVQLPQPSGLRALARDEGATLYMTLLATFGALLSRWSGQDDVVIGSPVAGRTREELEGLIGFFVNVVPLRADLGGDPTFRELLVRTRETVLEAQAHQDVPFERLVEELRLPRDPSRSPLFQAMFLLQDISTGPRLPGLRVNLLELETSTAKFDLSLAVEDGPEGLKGVLEYAADLFDAGTMERMAAHFALLLDAVVADPDRPVSTLPILTDPERAQLATWQTGPLLPAHVDLFPAQLAATVAAEPDTVALLCGTERVTYAELDARANRLAHHLRSLGVGPDVRVGICLHRSPELVVAALAVLKAGGAYVPVEPWFPADRIAAVMADADARVLLTTRTTLADLALPATCTPLALDERSTRDAIDRQPEDAPAITIDPESLAHVIYTSGSTGTPKGVMIRHASVAAFVAWMRDAFPLAPGERVLGATSFAFDVHVAELHYTLASGGTLVLVDNALSLAELAADAGIVQASMVPSAARELLALGALPGSIRRLNLAGEALPDDLARDLYAAGIPELHNVYGPTEDTTYSTHALVPERSGRVTIGRSFSGRRAYVLDRHLAPVPVGVTGDLFLAGCGVARGYLGRAGLTAEKFVPDPLGAAGERMYATGDRARWTASGEIEYLGRSDFQVKIRGFRIELGEIETVLRTHPAVAEAVVTAHGTDGAKRLVAYVSAPEGTVSDRAILSAHLKERLPEYMVPAAFVVLDAFPRTSTGKLDRRALPEPDPTPTHSHFPPRTSTERTLAGIWGDVLRADGINTDDNFFDLGGHSLLATRVVSRIRQDLRVELPLRVMFEAPILADLAKLVDNAAANAPRRARIAAADRSAYRVRIIDP